MIFLPHRVCLTRVSELGLSGQDFQTKLAGLSLPDQPHVCRTKSVEAGLPDTVQVCQTRFARVGLPDQVCQTKLAGPRLLDQVCRTSFVDTGLLDHMCQTMLHCTMLQWCRKILTSCGRSHYNNQNKRPARLFTTSEGQTDAYTSATTQLYGKQYVLSWCTNQNEAATTARMLWMGMECAPHCPENMRSAQHHSTSSGAHDGQHDWNEFDA